MKKKHLLVIPIILLFLFRIEIQAQSLYNPLDTLSFFEPAPNFHKKRFKYALGFSAAAYTGASVALYHAWYRQYPQESFHFFNDIGEWKDVDKAGHIYTAYFQGVLTYKGAKWTGMNEDDAIITGMICGGLFQSTIEVMDGFSSEWGFSVGDMAANLMGIGLFATQQHIWNEQRIHLKVSSIPITYSDKPIISIDGQGTTTLQKRTNDLYGTSFAEQFLKDYNAQTTWISFDIHKFLPQGNGWPSWLNIALGYGADNLFGGFDNSWSSEGFDFRLSESEFPRTRQYYIGFDLNLEGIKTKNHFVKSLLSIFNIFRVPSPALEINSQGQLTFHLLR